MSQSKTQRRIPNHFYCKLLVASFLQTLSHISPSYEVIRRSRPHSLKPASDSTIKMNHESRCTYYLANQEKIILENQTFILLEHSWGLQYLLFYSTTILKKFHYLFVDDKCIFSHNDREIPPKFQQRGLSNIKGWKGGLYMICWLRSPIQLLLCKNL